ncbi:hypothetical protein V8E52_000191 [Russula decolorans]
MRHSLCQLSLSSEDTSPDAKRALIRLAEKLKKNNVVLDMIAFGDRIEVDEGRHSILHVTSLPHLADTSMILNSLMLASNCSLSDELTTDVVAALAWLGTSDVGCAEIPEGYPQTVTPLSFL